MVGMVCVAGRPGRVELLKGKHCSQGSSCPVVLGLGKEGIGKVVSETIGQVWGTET